VRDAARHTPRACVSAAPFDAASSPALQPRSENLWLHEIKHDGFRVIARESYFGFHQEMDAYGCTVVAFVNCTPNPVPTSGSPVITENVTWNALRIGIAGETMLTDRLKISGEAAYLPSVHFDGLDQHFIGNSGVLAEIFPQWGNGRGVQFEALLSYYVTPQWSVGVGGRYWGMWTTSALFNCTIANPGATGLSCPLTVPTPPNITRALVEQAGAFVQTSYKFDWGTTIAALHK